MTDIITTTDCSSCDAVMAHPLTTTCDDCRAISTPDTMNLVLRELALTNTPALITMLRRYTPELRHELALSFAQFLTEVCDLPRSAADIERNWDLLVEHMPWETWTPAQLSR